jgi:hypothetical protein
MVFDPDRIVKTFATYMDHGGHNITRALFEQIMHQKMTDAQFTADISPLLANRISWDINQASEEIAAALIEKLPGDPWRAGHEAQGRRTNGLSHLKFVYSRTHQQNRTPWRVT